MARSADAFTTAPQLEVTATNDSVAGYTTADVAHQLDATHDVITHISGADAVEVEVGANDVAYRASCRTSLACYTSKVPQVEQGPAGRAESHRDRRAGARTHRRPTGSFVLLGYWSVWLGGAYASDDGDHPNAAGHQQIAKATADVISSALHLG